MTSKDEASRHAKLLWEFFGCKRGAYAEQQADGSYIKRDKEVTIELLEKHTHGDVTIAVYPVVGTGNCQWGMIDIDSKAPQAKERLVWIFDWLSGWGLSPLIEPSGSKGYHLWVLFKNWLPAAKVQRLLREAARRAEEEFGPPTYSVEVNPKQGVGDGYGNAVKLPWGVHRKTGKRTRFVDREFKPLLEQGA